MSFIGSYEDTRVVIERARTALENAMDEQGIVVPFPGQALDVYIAPEIP